MFFFPYREKTSDQAHKVKEEAQFPCVCIALEGGDVSSWSVDYQERVGRIYRTLFGRVFQLLRWRGVSYQDARDLTCEGVLFALEQGAKEAEDLWQNDRHFLNWLRKVGVNRVLDRSRRKKPVLVEDPDHLAARDHSGHPHECIPLLHDCLKKLPDVERRVLEEYYLQQKTDVEVGEKVLGGRPSSAVGQQARRIRKRAEQQLRRLLLEHGLDPEDWSIDWGLLRRRTHEELP
jgi:RNA polymerase sigma factor (sigma-70 family)